MSTLYCVVDKNPIRTLIHLLDTPQPDSQPANSVEDARRIIAESGAGYIHFYGAWLPQRPVAVDHPRLNHHIKDALGQIKHRPAKPYVPAVDPNFDPAECIDNF